MFQALHAESILAAASILSLLIATTLRAGTTAADQLKVADSLFDKREIPQAAKQYEEAAKLAKQEKDTSTLIEALSQSARCCLTQGDFDGCKKWLAEADALASDKFPAGWARYLGVKGRLEWREGRNPEATKYFKQMYSHSKRHGLTDRYMDAALMMGIAGDSVEVIDWAKIAIKDATEAGRPEKLPAMYNNLAASYADQGNYQDAYENFVKAREYHWQYSGEVGKLYAEYQVGWALYKLGKHDEALKWLRPSLAWAERLENDDVQAQACDDLGEIAIAQGKRDEGVALLKRSLEHAKKAGYETNVPEIYQRIAARVAELTK